MSLYPEFKEILELTQKEQAIIKEERFEELETLLKDKEKKIRQIEQEGNLETDPRQEEIFYLLEEIKGLNKENRQLIKEKIEIVQGRLEKLTSGWEILQRYYKVAPGDALILDRRG